ncbi:MAG: acetyl-CoA acetyltransferase [Planctomycetota bacterium]
MTDTSAKRRVAIAGIGYSIPRVATPDLSYREMTYEAATRAYAEAGIVARDIQCVTTCAEDFNEGVSIFDEYTPDQLGVPLKPVHTIAGDGIQGLAAAYMQVMTGLFDIAVVEAHSKASNITNHDQIINFATDPIFNRPLNVNPHYIAGMEMNRYLYESGNTIEQCAQVVVKNRTNAFLNAGGVFATQITADDVLNSEPVSRPLSRLHISEYSDVAIVMVLISEEKLKTLQLKANPIWINGVGWNSDTPWLETRDWVHAIYARLAAEQAYKMAGIKNPASQIDLFEIDDTYAYKELQHMEALNLCKFGESGKLLESGATGIKGKLPVNVSGGSLGWGNMLEATGLYRAVEAILQLRREAGKKQLNNPKTALVQSWRGIPTMTGAVVILKK